MNATIPGIHHVTAITADAQKNIDFYTGVLGLRLVKLTVNFDDPGNYHLYYGDELGRPGTILTFFAWPGAYRGRVGPPQVTAIGFAVPTGALDYWTSRLTDYDPKPADRFGDAALHFTDPDGLGLDIITVHDPAGQPFSGGAVPPEYAIRGFHSVTISEEAHQSTAQLLTEVMQFQPAGNEQNRFRYRATSGSGLAQIVDLLHTPDARRGGMGAGVVHHVAYRTPDDPQQLTWREKLLRAGLDVTPVIDRNYFHSIYYREPGGVLFEIATEPPGFTIDEPAEHLGTNLMLPPQYEPHRAQIEQVLPKVHLPAGVLVPAP